MRTRKLFNLIQFVFIILGLLLVLPIILGTVRFMFAETKWLNFIYDWGRSVFGSREVMWVAITAVITVVSIVTTIIWQTLMNSIDQDNKIEEALEKLKEGLQYEFIMNIDIALSNDIYIGYENFYYEELKKNLSIFKPHRNFLNDIIVVSYKMMENYSGVIKNSTDTVSIFYEKYRIMNVFMNFLYDNKMINKTSWNEFTKRREIVEKQVDKFMEKREIDQLSDNIFLASLEDIINTISKTWQKTKQDDNIITFLEKYLQQYY